eukprot:353169-Chlamydomonas_euryale.AAC.10
MSLLPKAVPKTRKGLPEMRWLLLRSATPAAVASVWAFVDPAARSATPPMEPTWNLHGPRAPNATHPRMRREEEQRVALLRPHAEAEHVELGLAAIGDIVQVGQQCRAALVALGGGDVGRERVFVAEKVLSLQTHIIMCRVVQIRSIRR